MMFPLNPPKVSATIIAEENKLEASAPAIAKATKACLGVATIRRTFVLHPLITNWIT